MIGLIASAACVPIRFAVSLIICSPANRLEWAIPMIRMTMINTGARDKTAKKETAAESRRALSSHHSDAAVLKSKPIIASRDVARRQKILL
jgi:hypothetical protein